MSVLIPGCYQTVLTDEWRWLCFKTGNNDARSLCFKFIALEVRLCIYWKRDLFQPSLSRTVYIHVYAEILVFAKKVLAPYHRFWNSPHVTRVYVFAANAGLEYINLKIEHSEKVTSLGRNSILAEKDDYLQKEKVYHFLHKEDYIAKNIGFCRTYWLYFF